MAEPRPDDDLFRWQALFQRSSAAVFLLNRRRRLLFANRAWEELIGLASAQARGRVCRRHRQPEPGAWEAVATALCPPAEVLQGQASRVRRLFAGAGSVRSWWDIDFLPFPDQDGLLAILGKIHVVGVLAPAQAAPLPEKLIAIREKLTQRYVLDDSPVLACRRVADQVRLAAQTQAPVLLIGPPGSGKHWLARVIHHHGTSRDKAFARLDCAGLPEASLTTVLFGPGGLTGRAGVGTLYLRGVSALPRELQARLADWLAHAEADRPRLIAGLSREPAAEVRAGRLLAELASALGTLPIPVPAARDRAADLPQLIEKLLERARGERPKKILTPQALELLGRHDWPGNLRELYELLVVALDRAATERIDGPDLPAYLRRSLELAQLPARQPVRPLPLDQLLEQIERRLIVLALRMAQGNKSKAAELLSIWRPRLLRRMEALGIAGPESE